MIISIKRLRQIEWLPIITALLLLCNLGPFYVWKLLNIPFMRYFLIVMGSLPFIIRRREFSQRDSSSILLIIITIIVYIFVGFIHDLTILGLAARLLTTLPIIVLFAEVSFLKKVFGVFYTIYSIIIFLALISYLCFILGLATELGTIQSSLEMDREYLHFPFLIMEMHMTEMFRFAGPFDEPGVVGTISAMLLCIKKYNLRDIRSIIVLISGLVSFSLFFYLISLIYVVFSSIFVRKKPIIAIFLFLLVCALYSNTKDDPLMYERLWSRVEWNSNNHQLEGDSRTSVEGRRYYKNTIGSWEWFWGLNNPSHYNSITQGSSTYMNIVMWHGAVFLFLYVMSLFMYVNKHVRSFSRRLLIFIIIILNIYQRPDIFGIVMLFIYSCMANYEFNQQTLIQHVIAKGKQRRSKNNTDYGILTNK